MDEAFKYDVAFSFLAQDEILARELCDLIQDRMRAFIYSEQQAQLAGRDGEVEFTRVFAEDSRLVVILYRKGWGETPFTRIEEQAIRARAFKMSYAFTLFIAVEDRPVLPEWLLPTQLWYGLSRYGLAGAAAVIDSKVAELGGASPSETVLDRVSRMDRVRAFVAKKHQFRHSESGVQAANRAFDQLREELKRLAEVIKTNFGGARFEIGGCPGTITVLHQRASIQLDFHPRIANSLDDTYLRATIWRGPPPFGRYALVEAPKKLMEITYEFDLLREGTVGWVLRNAPRVFSTENLADDLLKRLMDEVDRTERESLRR